MRLTTKGRYAVTAMLDLALHEDCGPVSLADISARQEISLSYLEQLFAKLRRAGLVSSVRGPGGGYRLKREGSTVFMAEIIDAVNENTDSTACQGKEGCHHGETCLTHTCLLYTSDAADERSSVDLGGRRIFTKKKKKHTTMTLRTQNHTTDTSRGQDMRE